MIISSRCTYCDQNHHDRYICSECGVTLGHNNPHNVDWLCCPFCGKPLYPRVMNREQRIEYTDKLYRG